MNKKLILVSVVILVLATITIATADENGVPFLLQQVIDKLEEVRLAITGMEINPIVNVTPNISVSPPEVNVEVDPNITLPEKECEWENRTDEHSFVEIGCSFNKGYSHYPAIYTVGYGIPKDSGYKEIRNIQGWIYYTDDGPTSISWTKNVGTNTVTLTCSSPASWLYLDNIVITYELLPANC